MHVSLSRTSSRTPPRHSAVVLDPDFAPFFVENFNDAEQHFVGAFAEWYGDLG